MFEEGFAFAYVLDHRNEIVIPSFALTDKGPLLREGWGMAQGRIQ